MSRLIALRSRVAREDGMTVTELLVAMSTGTIVLLALFGMIDQALPAQKRVADRVEGQQRGRLALEQMTQELRSAVCVSNPFPNGALQPPLVDATPTKVVFFTYMPSPAQVDTGAFAPEMRELSYDPATKRITRRRWTIGAGPLPTVATPETRSEVVLTEVEPSGEANTTDPARSSDVFAFFRYDATAPVAIPVSAADRARAARIRLGFVVGPANGTQNAKGRATIAGDVTIRLPPSFAGGTATGGPSCQV
jgi:hypothetical protein